jgi:hypothetical protein
MSIVNRRNAVLGWTVWQVGKRVAKRKAKEITPGIDADEPKRKWRKLAITAAVLAVAGVILFWKKKSSDDGPGFDSPIEGSPVEDAPPPIV